MANQGPFSVAFCDGPMPASRPDPSTAGARRYRELIQLVRIVAAADDQDAAAAELRQLADTVGQKHAFGADRAAMIAAKAALRSAARQLRRA